jgi:hypothetical protein
MARYDGIVAQRPGDWVTQQSRGLDSKPLRPCYRQTRVEFDPAGVIDWHCYD